MKDKSLRLGEERLSRIILRFSFTTLVALLFNSIYNLTDALFVSWGVGDNAFAGVSVVFPFAVLQGAISTAIGGGAASIVSRKLGENKKSEAGEVTLNAMMTFYITAIITTALGFIFMEPILKLMGVTGDIYAHAKKYFIIILAGNVFSTGFSSIMRAEGKMLYSLLIWVIPISINIILDAVFILVLGWGVEGSALATVICQFCSFLMSVLFFLLFSVQKFKGARIRLRQVKEIFAIGLPSLVQMGSISIITLLMNNILSKTGGTLAVSGFSYVLRLLTYFIMPFTAIAQALAPVAGYNYGAGNSERVKKSVRLCTLYAMLYAAFALAVAEAIPMYLLKIFTKNHEIISFGIRAMRITAPSILLTPLPMISGAAFQAIGRKKAALAMYAANLVFLIPLILIFERPLGTDGIWIAYVAASAFATVLAVVFSSFKLNKYILEKPSVEK